MSIFCTLQPRNQWSVEEAESEGYGEDAASDDGLIYESGDFEAEDEDDSWFDQLVARGLSNSSNSSDGVSEGKDMHGKSKPDGALVCEPRRPVARPLLEQPQQHGKVHVIEDSPIKVEDGGPDPTGGSLAVEPREPSKAEMEKSLREQIRLLEEQIQQVSTPAPAPPP